MASVPLIVRARAAKDDAVEIWAYIAEDNVEAANRLLERFDGLFRKLASQPQIDRAEPRNHRGIT